MRRPERRSPDDPPLAPAGEGLVGRLLSRRGLASYGVVGGIVLGVVCSAPLLFAQSEEPEPRAPGVYATVPTEVGAGRTSAQSVVGPGDRDRRARVAVRVEDVTVTVGEIEDFLWTSPPTTRDVYLTPEGRERILRQLLGRHLLAREAERRGAVTEETRYEVRRREERALVDLVELQVRAEAAAAPEGIASAPAAPLRVPEERFAVILRTGSREVAASWARDARDLSYDVALARANEAGEGQETPWALPDGTTHDGAASELEPALRTALWQLPAPGATSRPINLPDGRIGVVFLAGVTGGYDQAPPDESGLAFLRGESALQVLTSRLLSEHVTDLDLEAVYGAPFRFPEERSIAAMEQIAREREASAAEATAAEGAPDQAPPSEPAPAPPPPDSTDPAAGEGTR